MRKSLLAVAVLGAFAGTAMASDVTLYGVVDQSLLYVHTKDKVTVGDASASVKKNNFSMESGTQAGSRWGLKGIEQLGNGYSVGFVLEDGFTSDNGAEKGVMFDRESVLFVDGGFGRLYAGRQGSMMQGTGSVAKLGMLSAFGTSYTKYSANASSSFIGGGIRDNTLTYVTPKFAGFQVYAQYSMGKDGSENKTVENEKYAALAATYGNGPLNLLLGVDYTWKAHEKNQHPEHPKDAWTVTFGGNYDFGVAKIFGGVQYFDKADIDKFADYDFGDDYDESGFTMKGFGVNLSASAPLGGGTAMFGVSFVDAKQNSKLGGVMGVDFTRIRGTVGYTYPLSKRTNVYGAVTGGQDEMKLKGLPVGAKGKTEFAAAFIGLRHNF
jgi:predicted porin